MGGRNVIWTPETQAQKVHYFPVLARMRAGAGSGRERNFILCPNSIQLSGKDGCREAVDSQR